MRVFLRSSHTYAVEGTAEKDFGIHHPVESKLTNNRLVFLLDNICQSEIKTCIPSDIEVSPKLSAV